MKHIIVARLSEQDLRQSSSHPIHQKQASIQISDGNSALESQASWQLDYAANNQSINQLKT